MDIEDRSTLWHALCTIEDWIAGQASRDRSGRLASAWPAEDASRRGRLEPDFELIHASSAQPAAGQAATTAAGGVPIPQPARISGALHPMTSPGSFTDSLERIALDVSRCMACRLAATRHSTVPGQGVGRPLLLVVGEAPGSEEDAAGLPFVGPSGQLLDKMLAAIGLSRTETCYITNVVKCRPPYNRDPAPDEQSACFSYLQRQIAMLHPKAILCLGRVSAQALLASKESISRLRGRSFDMGGIPLVVTYHPSALLRDQALKRPAWEDLKFLHSILADG